MKNKEERVEKENIKGRERPRLILEHKLSMMLDKGQSASQLVMSKHDKPTEPNEMCVASGYRVKDKA